MDFVYMCSVAGIKSTYVFQLLFVFLVFNHVFPVSIERGANLKPAILISQRQRCVFV